MADTTRTLTIAASLLLIATCAKADPETDSIPPIDRLADACREAKAEFRPLGADDLKTVRRELVEAFERLDARLLRSGKNGAAWRKFLYSDELKEALEDQSPLDLSLLSKIDKRYAAEHAGLELVSYVDVHQALRRYRNTARNIDNAKLQPAFEALLDALAKHVEAHASEPTSDAALVIGQAVGQLEDARQVPRLVEAIRHHFARPNLFVDVSADLICTAMSRPVDETAPVRDVILGARISGTGHTTGQLCVNLIPDADRAAIGMLLETTTKSRTVARKSGARIHNDGTTTITTEKCVWIDEEGFTTTPAVSDATTRTRIVRIGSDRGSKVVENAARKRAAKQKSQAERIGASHAEQRANDRLDEEVASRLCEANEAFVDKFRKKLVERKLFPQQFRFSTTEEALKLVALKNDASRLAAATPPPELPEESDITVRLHESMIDNLAAGALAGRTLDNEQLRQTVVDLLGEIPEAINSEEEDDEQFSVTFDRFRPITVRFADGTVTLVIRGSKYTKGEKEYPAMETTAVYKIERTDEGFKAVRQGDLLVFPPGFDPESGDKMSTARVVIRRLLQRRMGKMLGEEIELGSIAAPDQWQSVEAIEPSTIASQSGWLTACWEMVLPEQPASSESSAAP